MGLSSSFPACTFQRSAERFRKQASDLEIAVEPVIKGMSLEGRIFIGRAGHSAPVLVVGVHAGGLGTVRDVQAD